MTAPLTDAISTASADTARVTAVVVAFHQAGRLRRLLVGLHHPRLEVVVVNVEADPAVRLAAGSAHVVDVADNPGYAAAVNAGVSHAHAPVVVFMNDDVIVDAAAVLRLAESVRRGADVAVPRVVDADGAAVRTIVALPGVAALAREWLLLPDRPVRGLARWRAVQKWRLPERPEVIDAAAGVMVAARRELLVALPLPEAYFLYWEENEWFWRLAQRHARVEYRTDVRCRHDGGRDDVRSEKSRLLARNAVRCVRRTHGRVAAVGAYLVAVAWNARLLAGDLVRLAGRPSRATRSRVRARLAGVGAALASVSEVR
jgi:GT2 family glycosyltransferase